MHKYGMQRHDFHTPASRIIVFAYHLDLSKDKIDQQQQSRHSFDNLLI